MKIGLKTFTANALTEDEIAIARSFAHSSYDLVGDIAIIRDPENMQKHNQIIADAIMESHNSVKSVWRQASPVSGILRLRKLDWVAGEKRVETVYREHGCVFKVDLASCYFSPRLSYERIRVARQVKPGEIIINMFAGVGCYSILIAKHSEADRIYSIDINPKSLEYMGENIKLNKVDGKVIPIQGDAKQVIQTSLHSIADRVLMPLPELAYEYLDYALIALKSTGGWIHYYDFTHAGKTETPMSKIEEKIRRKLESLGITHQICFSRIVRPTGPNWYQVVVDILVKNNSSIHLVNLL